MPEMPYTARRVDYDDPHDCRNLVRLFGEYADFEQVDPPNRLIVDRQLAEFPTTFSVLGFVEDCPEDAVGLVNCFFGFSTFTGQRLVNVHDVIVTQSHRGRGVGGVMLGAVERVAREHDCCRLTLEVYADNAPARRAYEKFGFTGDPAHPNTDTLFLRKTLSRAT